MELCSEILKRRGLDLLNQPRRAVEWAGIEEATQLIDNLEETPHFFVLACLMDRQISAKRAWQIPYRVGVALGGFTLSDLGSVSLNELTKIFEEQKLHRFNVNMAKVFYLGVKHIQNQYDGNAASIWLNNPTTATVIHRFLEFHGAGFKIATMATNILLREFKVPMSDYSSLDISVDVHIRRIFPRLGFVRLGAEEYEIVHAARELNRSYPGVFDLSLWEIGQRWCRPLKPDCSSCYLNECCPKIGVS